MSRAGTPAQLPCRVRAFPYLKFRVLSLLLIQPAIATAIRYGRRQHA